MGLLAVLTFSSTAWGEQRAPEGFFAEVGVGTGFSRYYEKAKARHLHETRIRSRSLSSSVDVLLGGAVVSGMVVGVGVLGRTMIDPSIQVNGVVYESTSATLGLAALSLFGQWYPGWVPKSYAELYLRAQGGCAESSVQFQHVALVGERQYGPLLGAAVGFSFAETRGFRFSAEAALVATRMTARESGARAQSSWYSGTYGLTVSYY